MGVTLERVQFKFASIIGELCSEPDILSQFAVWVDLRLAEYKLKGSISLDCSGETPDPVWLKGILSALLAKRLVNQRASGKAVGRSIPEHQGLSSPVLASPGFHSPLRSSNPMKDVPDSDVYPIGIQLHKGPSVSICQQDNRKRRASETLTRSDYVHDATKLRRFSSKETDSNTLPNESLMSIINAGEGSNNSATSTNIENITLNEQIKGETHNQLPSESDQPDFSCLQEPGQSLDSENNVVRPSSLPEGRSGHHTLNSRPYVPHQFRSGRLEAARRIRSDVNNFRIWLQYKSSHRDSRKIEDIPHEELDVFLEEYFSTIKTRSGGDYDPRSLTALRSCLERHLREHEYPHMIISSPLFQKSQESFRRKKQMLAAASSLTRSDVSVLIDKQLLGPFTPESLLNVIYWKNSCYFTCLKSKVDHFNLLWGDIELVGTEDQEERLIFTGEASRSALKPVGFAKLLASTSLFSQATPEDNPITCPIRMYKLYRARRPESALSPSAPFYLQISARADPDVWYLSLAMGLHDIGRLVRLMKEKAGLLPQQD